MLELLAPLSAENVKKDPWKMHREDVSLASKEWKNMFFLERQGPLFAWQQITERWIKRRNVERQRERFLIALLASEMLSHMQNETKQEVNRR